MKTSVTLSLVIGLVFAATSEYAIDFTSKGHWEMFFQAGEHTFLKRSYANKAYAAERFEAAQHSACNWTLLPRNIFRAQSVSW